MHMDFLTIIPARAGSIRLKHKNKKQLCGKPMISYTIEEALKSKYLNRIIVSSDDKEILKLAINLGVEGRLRSDSLSGSNVSSISVIQSILKQLEMLEGYFPDNVVLLQPTSPLRLVTDIDRTIQRFINNPDCDSALTVRTVDPFNVYVSNGAVFVSRVRTIKKYSNIRGKYVELLPMPSERSIDIDTEADFVMAEYFLKKRKENHE